MGGGCIEILGGLHDRFRGRGFLAEDRMKLDSVESDSGGPSRRRTALPSAPRRSWLRPRRAFTSAWPAKAGPRPGVLQAEKALRAIPVVDYFHAAS